MMSLSWACLNISVSLIVVTTPEFIISDNTLPAPTDGNWSTSPTRISLVLADIALSRLSIKNISIMDASSTIITSASIGSSSFFTNMTLSSASKAISSNLCIVLDSSPVVSVILLAALPVGAANTTLFLFFLNIFIIVLIVVVLPVPGPPVRTMTPFSKAALTA